ncbi:MAG: hypothetical protein VYD57_03005 [Pseudomonadota bacterium]|nr:hypothetical protein [Pseudomonadota bacterium]
MTYTKTLSPYATNNSVFQKTQAKRALRLRQRFLNDQYIPNEMIAIEFAESLYAVYHAVCLDYGCRYFKASHRKRMKKYRGRPAQRREVAPPSIPNASELSLNALMFHKLHRTDWDIPTSNVVSAAGVLAGAARERAIIDDKLNGRGPGDHSSVAALQDAYGPDPIEQRNEIIAFFRNCSPSDRYEALSKFHSLRFSSEQPARKILTFLAMQIKWRRVRSRHACDILASLERDLRDPKLFSAVDLVDLESRYQVQTLPPFRELRHIQSQTARIAIAMEASGSVQGTSKNISINQNLAFAVAAKFNSYLAHVDTPRKRHKLKT